MNKPSAKSGIVPKALLLLCCLLAGYLAVKKPVADAKELNRQRDRIQLIRGSSSEAYSNTDTGNWQRTLPLQQRIPDSLEKDQLQDLLAELFREYAQSVPPESDLYVTCSSTTDMLYLADPVSIQDPDPGLLVNLGNDGRRVNTGKDWLEKRDENRAPAFHPHVLHFVGLAESEKGEYDLLIELSRGEIMGSFLNSASLDQTGEWVISWDTPVEDMLAIIDKAYAHSMQE
ncbi:MAG: hypothetical protein H7A35_03610 [Planctomycetales bacterium]|nr:hypothetical protein [bacterium]UNM09142.1 MAG: hypothetical protein H7A35_03610 [Planctomycetales bacterium]